MVPVYFFAYNTLMYCIRGIESHKCCYTIAKSLKYFFSQVQFKILMVILGMSHLIIHPVNSYIHPIKKVAHYFLVYSNISNNFRLSVIASVSYTYIIIIAIPSSFTLYNRQVFNFHCLNPILRVVVLVYLLNQQRA